MEGGISAILMTVLLNFPPPPYSLTAQAAESTQV